MLSERIAEEAIRLGGEQKPSEPGEYKEVFAELLRNAPQIENSGTIHSG
jgi:hypothetical protein